MIYLAAFALGLASPLPEMTVPPVGTVRMDVFFSGTKTGGCRFKREANGAFESVMHLQIGATVIDSKVSGHLKGSTLVDYSVDQSGQGKTFNLTLKDGKLVATPKGEKPIDVPFDGKLTTYVGSLHPAFSAPTLLAAKWEKKELQSIEAFLVDGGAKVPVRVTPLQEKVTAAGKVRQYRVQLGMADEEVSMLENGEVVAVDVPGQKLRFVAEGWGSLSEDPFDKYPELSAASHEFRKLERQKLKTRDGVELVQDVFLPDGAGPFPVVFVRTPYDRHTEETAASFYAKRGYAYVAQDCRGRTDSEGDWDPFVHELNDGYDSIDWISKQPWCDGNVGMIGASYGGFVQWAAAASHHPALKCIVPQVSPPLDGMRNLPYDNGIFFLYGDVWWGKIVRSKNADMSSVLGTLPNPKGFLTLPLSKVDDEVLGYDVPFFNRWLEREGLDKWADWSFYDELKTVTIPALNISGWWDGDEIGTNLNWAEMQKLGRDNQWLIYGPWTHFFNSTTSLGDTDYGKKAMLDLDTLYIRWFDTWLKHKEVGMENIPHVQAFVMGANKWLHLTEWPSKQAERRTLYLSAEQSANGMKGKGRLLPAPPKSQAPSVYTYDPAKDVVPERVLNVDPTKQSTKIETDSNRVDCFRFASNPMPHPTAISGPIDVDLQFATSAKDTDFFVTIFDLSANGEMRAVGQGGKIRGSYIGGLDKPRPLTPGKVYTAQINLWDTAYQFQTGHRLAILISSGAFPIFARNLGTGEPIANATKMIAQTNRLFHDKLHPSKITFRVLWN